VSRTQSQGIEYFPFAVDFFADNKVKILKARYGADGIMIYMYILCCIYREGYYTRVNDDFIFVISDDLHISSDTVQQVMTFLLKRSMFNEQLFKSDAMKAQEIASERQQMSEKYRTHRRFFMRGVYYGTKISVPAEELYHKIRLRLYGLLGYIDAMVAVSDYQQETSLEFYQGIRQDIREYVEMVKTLALPGKEGFFQELAGALLREDLDETKSYSDRCAEKREREAAYFAEPHKLPRIKKVDKLAEERLVEKGKAPEEKSRVLLLEHSEGRRGVAAQG
jgi:hypothetical protein